MSFKLGRDYCNNCGSFDLEWGYSLTSNSGVQNGRLAYHDIQVTFYQGCNNCSETLALVNADKILEQINAKEVIL